MDPQTLLLWGAGAGFVPGTGNQTGAVVQIDAGGKIKNAIGLSMGQFGSPCTVGPFNYCLSGSSSVVKGLAIDAAGRTLWAAGTQFDARGGHPVLFVAAIDLNTSSVVKFLTETSTGTQARGAAISADGSVWIAGVDRGAATIWNADAATGLQVLAVLADNGRANAVIEASSGTVWATGRSLDTGEMALWNYDPRTGTINEYLWKNTLGGVGSAGTAIALAPGGNVWLAGQTATGPLFDAAIWKFSAGAFTAAASTGPFNDVAFGLALDDGGNAWVTGASEVDAAGNAQFALWELPMGGSSLGFAATYVDPSFTTPPFIDQGNGIVYSQGRLLIVGTLDNNLFATWSYSLKAGNLLGVLGYSVGFSSHNVVFALSPTPAFNGQPRFVSLAAPTGGTTSFSYALVGLAAPATYYVAAIYDITDSLFSQNNKGVPSGDPLGIFQDDASGVVTKITPVFVPSGSSATGVNFTVAMDTQAPAVVILSPVAGSTITASRFSFSGTAQDDTSVANVLIAVQDLSANQWWDGFSSFITTTTVPLYSLQAHSSGPFNAVFWQLNSAPSLAPIQAALQAGRSYEAFVSAQDLVGKANTAMANVVIVSSSPAQGSSGGQALARSPDGHFWVVANDFSFNQAVNFRLERYDSAGVFLSSVSLPGANGNGNFGISFDASGDAWVSGGVTSGTAKALGLWESDPTGSFLVGSTAYVSTLGGQIFPGRLAVDAAGNAWVAASEQTTAGFTFRHDLFKFGPGVVLASGFPKTYQRGGGLDGGFGTAVDASGNVWSAGVSSNPATGKIDLGLWKNDSQGNLLAGFPVFWPSAFKSVNMIDVALTISMIQGKTWIATEKDFDACASPEFTLLSYDANGVLISSGLWHNDADSGARGRNLALDGFNNVWAVGTSSNTSALWKYDSAGNLYSTYPRSFQGKSDAIAVDGAGNPWVLSGNIPTFFSPSNPLSGTSGPAFCALSGIGQVSGVITSATGFSGGSTTTVAASTTMFHGNGNPLFFMFLTSTGTALSYNIPLQAPATYTIAAVGAAINGKLTPGTPIGVYNDYAPVAVAAGATVPNVNFSIAPDNTPPTSGITSILSGSTLTAIAAIAGTAADNVGVGNIQLAVHDLTFDLWWAPFSFPQQWITTTTTPLFSDVNSMFSGKPDNATWLQDIRPNNCTSNCVISDNYGGLAGFLTKGHQYRVYSAARDFVNNVETNPTSIAFLWNGPTGGALPPAPPQNVQAFVQGTSSISWTWSPPSNGASFYNVYSGTAVFLSSTTQTSFLGTGLSTNTAYQLCVSGVNQFGEGAKACAATAYTFAATPGQPVFTSVFATSVTISWSAGGNPPGTVYQAYISTNNFATNFVIYKTTQTTTTFLSLPSQTTVYAAVQAYNGANFGSAYSPVVSTTTLMLPPQQPQNVAGAGVGVSSISWTWSTSLNATGYNVYSSTGGFLGSTATPPFYETGLSTASTTNVCVSAFNAAGESMRNCGPGVSTLAATPAQLTASFVSSSTIAFSWDAAGNPSNISYQVLLSTDNFVSSVVIVIPFSSTYTQTNAQLANLAANTTYYLRVQSENGAGQTAGFSPTLSTRTLLPTPGTPQGLALGTSSITWTWSASVGADGYTITSSSGGVLGLPPSNSFIEVGLSTNAAYVICAVAFSNAGNHSFQVCSPQVYTAAAVPGQPFATAVTSFSIALSWDAAGNSPTTPYQLLVSTDGFVSSSFAQIPFSSSYTQTSAVLSALLANTTYSLRVQAQNSTGQATAFSPTFAVRTLLTPPSNLQGSALGTSSITWTWGASAGAAGYNIYSSSGGLLAIVPTNAYGEVGLSTNVAYSICAAAFNQGNFSVQACSPVVYTAAAIPGQPFATAVTSASLAVSWDAAGNPFGTPYQLSLSTDNFATSVSVPIPFASSYTQTTTALTNLSANTTYFLRLQAQNFRGQTTDFSTTTALRTLLTPPVSLQGSALGTSSITWTWGASVGASGYNVFSGTGGLIGSPMSPTFVEIGLSTDTQNSICAFAFNPGNFSVQACSPLVFTRSAVPGQPIFFGVSFDRFTLSWDAQGNPFGVFYQVQLSNDNFASNVVTAIPFSANFVFVSTTLAGLASNTTYYARIQAQGGDGLATAVSQAGFVRTLFAPPQAPVNLTATTDNPAKAIRLAWAAAPTGAPSASFNVWRGVSSDTSTFSFIAGSTTTMYADLPSQSGTYYYQVSAINPDNLQGPRSNVAIAGIDLVAPQTVSDLRVSAVRLAQKQADLSWTAPFDIFNDVTKYFLYVSPTPSFGAGTSSFTIAAQPAGSTVTFTVSITTTQAYYFAETTLDFAGNVSPFSNVALLDTVPPTITSLDLADGLTISRPRQVNVTAADNVAVAGVSLSVDGVLLSSAAGTSALFLWDTRLSSDGFHTVTITAVDTSGNQASVSRSELINYAPPAAPVITNPAQNFGTKVATINVTGAAENLPGMGVQVLANNVDLDSAAVNNGAWQILPETLPVEGNIALTAVAFESRGFSSPSAPVNGVFSTHSPHAPELPAGTASAGGQANLTWSAPSSGVRPAFYRVYRSTDDLVLIAGQPAPAASFKVGDNINGLSFTEIPPVDDLYFYAITAVDGVGNESVLSNVVYVVTDRVPPTAGVVISTPTPLGVGTYLPRFLISEPLSLPPIFTFTPPGGQPSSLNLSAITATLWQATVTVTSGMGEANANFAFQGIDFAGNVGTRLSSATLPVDTVGPMGTVSISKISPLSTGTLSFSLSLNEAAASTPTLSVTPLGGAPLPINLSAASPYDNKTWSGSVVISSTTGDGQAVIAYSGVDPLGNVNTTLTGGTTALVIDTIAPGMPQVVRANSLPGGKIMVTWSPPFGETPAYYHIFRDNVRISTNVTPQADATGAYTDLPSEGFHQYQVSSLDLAGNESAATDPVALSKASLPAPPVNVQAAFNAFNQVQVTWQQGSTDTVKYNLYRTTYTIASTAGLGSVRNAVSPFVDSPSFDAVYHYVITALDAVGNESTVSVEGVVTWAQGAPMIQIFGVTDGAFYKTNVAPTYQITDLVLDTRTINARLDGAAFVSGSTVAIEGSHLLSVSAANTAGHYSTATASFTLDKTPPQIAFSMTDGASITSTSPVTVSITITELNPATSAFTLVNQTLGTSVPYLSGQAITRNGQYALSGTATDLAGNTSTAAVNFHLEIAPAPPVGLTVSVANTASLRWTSPEPDVVAYRIYRDGSRISASLFTDVSFVDTGFTPGGHVYQVSAVDASGVEGPKAQATIPAANLSLTPPTLTRGFFDTMPISVQNNTGATLTAGPAYLTLTAASGFVVAAGTAPSADVGAGLVGTLSGVLATPAGLSASSLLHVSVAVPTDPGSSVSLTGDFTLSAQDPAQPLLEVFPGALVPGTLSPVQVRFYNRGSAPLDVITAQVANSTYVSVSNVSVQLQTAQGTLLGSGGVLQADNGASAAFSSGRQVFFVTVPPGQSVLFDPIQVLVPNTSATSVNVAAFVSTPTYNLPFLNLPGTRSFASATAQGTVGQVAYTVTALPQRFFYDQGSSVTITGQALDSISGFPVPNASVAVHVLSNGFNRQITAVTDSSGSYTAVFFPLPNEAGLYTLSAVNPSVVTFAAQSSFTIVGLSFSNSNFTATLAQNSNLSFTMGLTNTGASTITGLSFSTAVLTGSSVTLAVDPRTAPSTLAAGQTASLGLSLSALPMSTTSNFVLTVTEAHGFSRTLPVMAVVVPAQVIPVVTPQEFDIGMLGGDVRTLSFQVANKGFDTWKSVQLTSPALSWVTIQGQGNLGDMPPGASANVTLQAAPPSSLSNGTYAPNPLLQITSLNMPPVPVLAAIAITSTRKGDVLVTVINADKPRSITGQGVGIPGAKVTLNSLDVAGLSFSASADLNGVVAFTQVPSGNYAWTATATGFQALSGTAVIEPGMTNKIEAILPTATVSYQWIVTPTTIVDRYDIALNLTFRTDVLAPALIVDPALIPLNLAVGQSAFTQFTITNKGLVSAFNVNVTPDTSDSGLQADYALTQIPEIKAGQSVTVPVKITLLHASCDHKTDPVITGQYMCQAGITTTQSVPGPSIPTTVNPPPPGCPAPTPGPSQPGGPPPPGESGVVCGSVPCSSGGTGPGYIVPPSSGLAGCSKTIDPDHPQGPSCGGANPLDGSHNEPSHAPLAFPAHSVAPSYDSGYNSLNPPGVNPPGPNPPAPNPPGWSPPTPTINPNASTGSIGRTNPNGSRQTLVPFAPLNQPVNGTGRQFARPVQDFAAVGYDPQSNTFTQREKNGTVTKFQGYGATGTVSGVSMNTSYLPVLVTDRNGNTLTYTRDATTGAMLKILDSYGRSINFTYNSQGQLIGASDSAGRSTSYGYDANGNKTSETDVNGDTTHYAYDANHRMTLITYPNGGTMSLVYDGQGRVSTEQEDNGNNKNTYTYNSSSTIVVDALNHSTEFDWTSVQGLRKFTRIVDANGGVTTLGYDTSFNLASQTDPLGHTTKYAYDPNGNVTAAIDANAGATQTSYDPNFSMPTNVTDAKGNKTTMTLDAKGNTVTAQDAASNFTNMAYNAQGHVTSNKDPLGNLFSFSYDANGALASASDPLNRTTNLTNDALSRVTQNTDSAGNKTIFAYDSAGNMTQVKDALNGVTSYAYQTGRNARDLQILTDANNHATTFGYDIIGRPTRVTNALSQSASIGYDKLGNPVAITTKNGQTITFAYDILNRLSAMALPEGQLVYSYDATGNVLSAAKYNGTALAYTHDSLNRITRLTETLDNGFSDAATFAYDADSNRTAMSSALGSLTYGYDALNRLTSLVSGAGSFTFTYDADSRLNSITYPNGIKETLSYDAAGQVIQIVHQKTSNQTAVAFISYSYDASGNRATLVEPAGTHGFSYDALNRLTTASHPAASSLPVLLEAFSFDAVGNRTTDALRSSYQYDAANRITSDSSMTYTSDGNGNRTSQTTRASGQTTTFKYDSQSRLVEVDGPGNAVIASYKSDPDGRRIEKAAGGLVTRFAFDGPTIRAILGGDNSVLVRFTYIPGIPTPLAMQVQSTSRTDFVPGTYFLHADALGSVIALTDAAGNLVESYEYQAFGRAVVKDAQGGLHDRSTVGNPYLFAGMTSDQETGLNHATYREQDPETGGFLQEDPIGGEMNLFAYVKDEPTLLRDPFGLYGDPDYPGPGHRWPPGGRSKPQPHNPYPGKLLGCLSEALGHTLAEKLLTGAGLLGALSIEDWEDEVRMLAGIYAALNFAKCEAEARRNPNVCPAIAPGGQPWPPPPAWAPGPSWPPPPAWAPPPPPLTAPPPGKGT